MNYQLILRPEADSEFAEARRWYEGRREGLGVEFELAVEAGLDAICRRPMSFPIIHRNVRRTLIRRFLYGIFYLVEKNLIEVISIFHAKRDPSLWKFRVV